MSTTDANPSGYPIAAAPSEIEYEVKKSRFIARAAYAANRDEALSILQQARADYPEPSLLGLPDRPAALPGYCRLMMVNPVVPPASRF